RLAMKAVAAPDFPGLEAFASRAWRRPLDSAERDELQALMKELQGNGNSTQAALTLAVQKGLLSPHFLYRVEYPPNPQNTAPFPLGAHALASRLSYFIWSSMPDDQLMAAANSGKLLTDEKQLEAQVRRMLADPKSSALADNLAGQWLRGR